MQDRSTRGLSQTAADLGLAGENVEHRQGVMIETYKGAVIVESIEVVIVIPGLGPSHAQEEGGIAIEEMTETTGMKLARGSCL
mmetsp:Transcript_67537/g.136881  ORF Transcript_67537/g.136881 Transcript_67537/m.136881 type:complete len:83 (-) Transcript_67537:589-837(-)